MTFTDLSLKENPINPERFTVPHSFINDTIRPIIPFEETNFVLIKEITPANSDAKEVLVCDLVGNKFARAFQLINGIVDIRFMSGKFGKTSALIDLIDPEFNHLRILAIEDSFIKAQGKFEVEVYANIKSKAPSKTSSFIVSSEDEELVKLTDNINKAASSQNATLLITSADTCFPESVENAIKGFFSNGICSEFRIEGKFVDKIHNKYNVFIPSAGLGTRIGDAIWAVGNVCKPAMPLPAKIKGQDYLLIQDTLANLTRAGILGTATEIDIIREKAPMGSASGLIRALEDNRISVDKPIIVRQCDAFSDIDFSKVLKIFEERKAGVLIAGLPVDENMLSAVGIIGTNDDMEIVSFLEKPGSREKAEPGLIKGNDRYAGKYLGSIGMYIFSSAVLKWMQNKINVNNDFFKGKNGLCDFANDIFPRLMEAFSLGEIKDEHGKALKMLSCVVECNWSDFGFTIEYINELRKSAAISPEEGGYNIPKHIRDQFIKNINLETGVICLNDTKNDFDKFCKKFAVGAKGNILVTKKP